MEESWWRVGDARMGPERAGGRLSSVLLGGRGWSGYLAVARILVCN